MKKLSILSLFVILTSFTEGLKPGDQAINFNLKNVDGKMISLDGIQNNKGVILVFTCNHCPFSKAYEDRIMKLDQKYASAGYPVVAINPNDPTIEPEDSFENMQKLAKEKHFTFPYLFDETQATAKAYGALRTPHVFVLKKGTEKGYTIEYIGAIDDNSDSPSEVKSKYVENAVDALLNGKEVAVRETKAIGCGIKWKMN